jgi:hypothetical protein
MTLKRRYAIGDTCWISAGFSDEEGNPVLVQGFVVHRFELQHHPSKEFYVIEAAEPGLFNHQVRDVYLMTDSPEKTLPISKV